MCCTVALLALTPAIARLNLYLVALPVAAEVAFVVQVQTVPKSRQNDDDGGDGDASFLAAVASKAGKGDSLYRGNVSVVQVDHLESREIVLV